MFSIVSLFLFVKKALLWALSLWRFIASSNIDPASSNIESCALLQLRVVLGVPDNSTLLQPSDHIIVLIQWDTSDSDKVKAEWGGVNIIGKIIVRIIVKVSRSVSSSWSRSLSKSVSRSLSKSVSRSLSFWPRSEARTRS